MLVISDLHLKRVPIFRRAQTKFFGWLLDNYRDQTVVFLGDLFDTNIPNNDLESDVIGWLKQFKEVHIVTGNHDKFYPTSGPGNVLAHFSHHDNIFVYDLDTRVIIEGKSCLMLPYQKNMQYYTKLSDSVDYVFTHAHHPAMPYAGDDGIDLTSITAAYYFYGHSHTKATYSNHYVLGVPLPTKNLECSNSILKIENDKIVEIEVPEFFKIVTVKYNEVDELNPDYLYNITDAPSVKNVYEKFKKFKENIRKQGITIFTETEGSIQKILHSTGSLSENFIAFCKFKDESSDPVKSVIKDICVKYL